MLWPSVGFHFIPFLNEKTPQTNSVKALGDNEHLQKICQLSKYFAYKLKIGFAEDLKISGIKKKEYSFDCDIACCMHVISDTLGL